MTRIDQEQDRNRMGIAQELERNMTGIASGWAGPWKHGDRAEVKQVRHGQQTSPEARRGGPLSGPPPEAKRE